MSIEPDAGRAAFSARHALEKSPVRPPVRQIMLSRKPRQFDARSARREKGRRASVRTGPRVALPYARVAIWPRPALRASASPTRDTARPMSPRGHNASARQSIAATPASCPKLESQIVIAARLEQGERAFQMLARFDVLSGEPMRRFQPCGGQHRPQANRVSLNVAEKRRRVLPHRRQLAANVAADPQTE